jgi:hypothetical protein
MKRSLSISNRSRSNKAARTVFHWGANELRIAFPGRGAPICGVSIAGFFRQAASCVKEQTAASWLIFWTLSKPVGDHQVDFEQCVPPACLGGVVLADLRIAMMLWGALPHTQVDFDERYLEQAVRLAPRSVWATISGTGF